MWVPMFGPIGYWKQTCKQNRHTSKVYVTSKDNIYIDMQAGRNLLPKLLVADN